MGECDWNDVGRQFGQLSAQHKASNPSIHPLHSRMRRLHNLISSSDGGLAPGDDEG
jgi:hypothetical protein